jgi:hypothetical protein
MSGHTTEEKLKILYEDSLRDIRGLARSMEAISKANTVSTQLINSGKSVIRAENERLLMDAVMEIKNAVVSIIVTRDNLNDTAAKTARALMTGDDGPIKQLQNIVKQQQEALGWLNRATRFYEQGYVTKPMVWSLLLGGLCGGVVGGAVCGFMLRGV